VVTPDKYHPPLLLGFNLTLDCHRVSLTPHRSYDQRDCLLFCRVFRRSDWFYVLNENSVDSVLFCHVFRRSDWFCVLNENSVDSAVNNLTAIVREAVHLTNTYIKP
jgi:hypothetical protein